MSRIRPITLPKWGLEMSEGTITAWHVEEGGRIADGADLVDIETEKIVNTLDVPVGGVLRRRLAEVGTLLPVGALIAVIADAEVADADIDAAIRNHGAPAVPPAAPVPAPAQALPREELERRNAGVHATPLARRRATELGLDLTTIAVPGARVSQEAVDAEAQRLGLTAAKPAATPAPEPRATFVPFTPLRRTIAARLVQARRDVPSFSVAMDVEADSLQALRERLNANAEPRVSLTDLVVKAAAQALAAHPDVNVHVSEDGVYRHARADIAIAVAVEGGLVAPVLRDVGSMPIRTIARTAADLITRARSRSLAAEDLKGATFTVSNLGMRGVRAFDAIIDPPQAAILAVGAVRRAPREARDGGLGFVSEMTLTLSADHRAVDGDLAARFLGTLRDALEKPDALAT